MTLALAGIGIAAGRSVAIGEAILLQRGPVRVSPRWVANHEVEAEIERFYLAVESAHAELRAVRDQLPPSTARDVVEFVDAHLLMLEDRTLLEAPAEMVREEALAAEWALQLRRDALVRVFEDMEDPYLRTRKDDLDHVVSRIQKHLLQLDETLPDDLSGCIVLARDLTPADTIVLRQRGVGGLVTEFGGPMSHTAILARSLGLPAVLGVRHATEYLRQGETLVLDAASGSILADCDTAMLRFFENRLRAEGAQVQALQRLRYVPAVSADGESFWLLANIELPEDIAAAHDNGAVGVGLYRTEFLYMNRSTPPDEDEHYRAYRDVVEGLDGIPVTIRTLDLGADKTVDGHPPASGAGNPALGLRAIRLCLKEPALFRPQLRAILRVSALGSVRIMLPMLTNVWEVLQTRALIEDIMRDLRQEGVPFDPYIPVGGMIEVPAAALSATLFAHHLDFLSIGTNDLVQYTLATDRVDDEVNFLFDPTHPAVLRLIKMTIDAASTAQIPLSMCGEMAGDPMFIPLLVGMGLREFSMQPGALLNAKRLLRELDAGALTRQVDLLMTQLDRDDFAALVANLTHH